MRAEALAHIDRIEAALALVRQSLDWERALRRLDELNARVQDPTLWDNPKDAQAVSREQKQLETQRFAEVQDRYYAQSDAIDEMRARIQERTAELGIAADPMGKEITKEYLEKVAQKKEEMDKEKALNVDIFGGKKLFDNYYGNFTSLPEALFYETTTLDLPTPLDLGRDTFVVFIIALLATIWVLFIDYVGEKALDPIFHFDISRQTGLGTLSDIVKGSDDASFIDAAPSAPPLIP